MHSDPVSRPTRRLRWMAPIAAVALLAAGVALAASTIDAGAFSTSSATVWKFLQDNSGRRPATNCYDSTSRPDENYTCLLKALSATGLDKTLQQDGPITVFAPTDAGFKELAHLMGAALFNRLMQNEQQLATVLRGLMVQGRYTSADLQARAVPATGRLTLPTLAKTTLQLTFDRFPSGNGRVKVAVGGDTFQTAWTPYLSGQTTLLDNGAVIPMDMVYLPASMR